MYNKKKPKISNIKFFKFNEKNLKYINTNYDIDIVINAAGLTNVDLCEKDKKKANYSHITILKKTIKNLNKNLFYVHISTDHLFDGKNFFYSEKSVPKPINYYAKTKLESEKIIKKLKNYLIIRGNFFCWGSSYRKSFSDWIFDSLKKKKNINLFSDIYFNPLYIETFIDLIFKLIIKNKKGIFNLSSNQRISKYFFGIKLAKIFKLKKKFIIKSKIKNFKMVDRPKNMSLENKKIKKILKIDSDQLNIETQINLLKKRYNSSLFLKNKSL